LNLKLALSDLMFKIERKAQFRFENSKKIGKISSPVS